MHLVETPKISLLQCTNTARRKTQSGASKWKKDAENLGINFIILDNHYEVAKNIYATGTVKRAVETYNGPKGLVIKDRAT